MYLKAGEQLTLETLLYGLLLCSGNDAAVAIAEHISGSRGETFADLMNETAPGHRHGALLLCQPQRAG